MRTLPMLVIVLASITMLGGLAHFVLRQRSTPSPITVDHKDMKTRLSQIAAHINSLNTSWKAHSSPSKFQDMTLAQIKSLMGTKLNDPAAPILEAKSFTPE
jgi:hypothetical protein